MKLVAWNLAHQTQERAISPRFIEVVEKLQPDLITLNEYVHGSTREPLLDALAQLGLGHVQVSNRITTNNQVFVASRHPLQVGGLLGPATENGAGESNFLHVTLPNVDLEIVGIRAPAYKTSDPAINDYWRTLTNIIRPTKARRIIFIGDFNADPDASQHLGSRYMTAFRAEGWNIPAPSGPWSYISGSRIDHAIASPSITVKDAEYVAQIGEIDLASKNKGTRISDHAALVLHVDIGPPRAEH